MIEKFFEMFERLIVAMERRADSYEKLVEGSGAVEVEPAPIHGVFPEVSASEEKPPSVDGPQSYEQLLEAQGLPYLKNLCQERGIAFLPLAKSKSIIDLLKDWDAKTAPEPVKQETTVTEPEPDPFAAEQPAEVIDDPFATTSAPGPAQKEVTEEELRDKLKDLRDVFENKNPTKGTAKIIEFMEKEGGVRILKELPKEKYASVFKAANDEILRLLK